MSLIETMLSIFLIPSQCRTSGINAWKRISYTEKVSVGSRRKSKREMNRGGEE